MSEHTAKLAIIAGGGAAPRELIEACRRLGREFFVFCLQGHADPDLAKDAPHEWLPIGAANRLREIFLRESFTEAVMIGRVRRPSLTEIRPDWLALKMLTKIGMNSLGDDGLLRAIGKVIEEESGVRMIGAHEIFGGWLMPEGVLTTASPDTQANEDIRMGIKAARALGRTDVGQAVVVQQGAVLGVEEAEGTDALMARCASLRREGLGGVLVKMAKPQQDNRFDLPSIGPETVKVAVQAGLRGIATEAGRSLLLDRDKTISTANEAGVFVMGVNAQECGHG